VRDVRVTEGDAYGTIANVRVVLSEPAARRVTAEYTTLDGSARAADYVGRSGTLVIPRGHTTVTTPVTIKGDELDERNEYLRFRISDPVHATIADRVGLVRIVDNDPAPYLVAGDALITEPVSGYVVAKLPVTMSEVSGRYVSVDYAIAGGSAVLDSDFYAPEPTGTLVFSPGSTTRAVKLVVLSDSLDESTETVYLTISDPVHGYVSDSLGVASIIEDEPRLSVDDRAVAEGQAATFTVRLNRASSQTVQVYYATAGYGSGSGLTAVSGTDFYSTSGWLTFAPGTTTRTVTVSTIDDTTSESTETFALNLSSATKADIGDSQGIGTITDNDGLTLNVADVRLTEGAYAGFRVYLSAKATTDVSFDYATAAGTADEPSDFVQRSGNDIEIAKGQTEVIVWVTTVDDTRDEPDETFFLNLSDIHGAKPGDVQAVATIVDNDPSPTPTISIDDDTLAEGEYAQFLVELSAPASTDVTFDWATEDGTATADNDYKNGSGNNVTITKGVTRLIVSVQTIEDAVDEPTENFSVNLSDVHGAVAGDLEGVATIVDDDDAGLAQVDLGSVSGDGASSPLIRSGYIAGGDVDWYKFTLTEDDTTGGEDLQARVDLSMATSGGDLDIQVYRADGVSLLGSSTKTGTDSARVSVTLADTAADDDTVLVIKVFGKATSSSDSYTLTVTGDTT
jgi:hypothetical protein